MLPTTPAGFNAPDFYADDPQRLTSRDKRLIFICVVVAVAALAIALRYFQVAFPEASIDFRVSRAESGPMAEAFLSSRGFKASGYRHSARFGYDDETKTFFERELGLAETQKLVNTRVHLWRWENRWFRPLQKEEWLAAVDTRGGVVGFDHEIAEADPGARLSLTEARAKAEQYLTTVAHIDLATVEFVSAEALQRPNRTDYTFIWKDRAALAPGAQSHWIRDADYRRQVRIQGADVGQYREFVRIPDGWLRDYEALRSKNNTAGIVDEVLFISILGIALLATLVLRIRRRDVRWRTALWIGVTGGVLGFLSELNDFPLTIFGYDTTQSYSAFTARQLVNAIFAGIAIGVFLTILTAAAEPLYRERFPRKQALPSFLRWRGIRTKAFLMSVTLGMTLAAFFFAYQTVFYLIANHFGAWAPSDVPYDDILSTWAPWLFVLLGGFWPAIFEEFTFRMFAIPLFERWFRFLWPAVILASFLWGFGHATYPNQPFYIRGVEVGLGGVLLSWVMIRFNILSTVVWHYTVDAIYTALLLMRSHNTYLRTSGALTAFIAAIPLLFAVIAYLKIGGFADSAGLKNEDEGSALAPAQAEEAVFVDAPAYTPVGKRRWIAGYVAGAILAAGFFVGASGWRPLVRFTSTASQAEARARAFLKTQGFDVRSYRFVLTSSSAINGVAAYFDFKAGGQKAVLAPYSPPLEAAVWQLRFFQPLQKEEFHVSIAPDAHAVTAYEHTVDDIAPGASLATDVAQRKAEAFLRSRGIDPAAMTLKSSNTEQKKARADSSFTWEAQSKPGSKVSPTPLRVDVGVQGDSIGGFRSYLYVPEAQVRAYEKTSIPDVLLNIERVVFFAGIFGVIIWAFVQAIRSNKIRWRTTLILAAVAAVLAAISIPLRLSDIVSRGYDTSIPWSAFMVSMWGSAVLLAVVMFLAATLLLGGVHATFDRALAATASVNRGVWGRDAALAAVLALLWLGGWQAWRSLITSHFVVAGWPSLPSVVSLGSHPTGALGLITAIIGGAGAALLAGILLPIGVAFWRRGEKVWVIGALVLLWIASIHSPQTGAELALALAVSLVDWLVLAALLWWFLRNNALAYLASAVFILLVASGASFIVDTSRPYSVAGGVLIGIAILWLLWVAFTGRRPEPLEEVAVYARVPRPPSSLTGRADL